MRQFLPRLLNLDRRVIFLAVGLAILIPIIRPLNLPGLKVTAAVRGVYDQIEALGAGSPMLISFDFDPASKPELYPMGLAIVRHAFRRDLKVIGTSLWITGAGLAEEILHTAAREHNKAYGEDYVFLGWQPQPVNVIIGLGQDLYKTFPKDHRGNDTRSLPALSNVTSLKDIRYLVDLAAGTPGVETWIVYGADRYGVKVGGGSTAVIEPGLRPFLQTGQLTGLIGAMKGAAEYEALLGQRDKATAGMDALSIGHMLVIALVALSNVAYWLSRRTN
ncbi:MAG: hypothetical protein HYZ81_10635 [Nitrospinae bacterium]|nr:hypothetical protein [Nitrospinota bacterium]